MLTAQQAISEQLHETEIITETTPSETTFRLVVTTQVCEWYGDEDGNGRWKFKGGNEHIIRECLTISDILRIGHHGLQQIVDDANLEKSRPARPFPHESYQYVIDWQLYGSNEETHDEELERLYR